MNELFQLFARTLEGPYIQLEENAASYRTEQRGSTLFLFFEKSNGAVDWKNNFDFPAKPYREMKDLWFVHRGFLRVFKSIEPHVAPLIADPNIQEIIISGYSHGAAIALLCHEYCVYNRPDLKDHIHGYGFGCPRVVWGPCGAKSRFENFRVIRNGSDLVTHLPPVIFGFRHVGTKIKIGKGQGYCPIDAHRQGSYLYELKRYQGEGEE